MNNIKISLLVPTMNNPWYLDTTIRSAYSGAIEPIEILVYSNNHNRITEEIVAKLQLENIPVKIVHMTIKNDGVAKAVNTLAKASIGEFLFYTADDAYLLPGWDTALLKKIVNNEWQYLTPRSIEPTGTNPCMYAPFNFGRTPEDFNKNNLIEWWKDYPKQDIKSCAGPPFVARWIWESVGGFDEQYFPGFGTDPDFAHAIYSAAKRQGKKAQFIGVGDAGFYHFQCVSTSRVRTSAITALSHKIFEEKWGKTTKELSKLLGDGEIL